jgi:nucleoside-diphosphate-sugar epimerase
MKNILITGLNGFLGSHLIDLCIKKDFKIYGSKRSLDIHYQSG